MANTTGSDRLKITPWTTDRSLRLPAATPGTSVTFYAAQAAMRDVNGNMIQCDDTQKGEFIGFIQDIIRTQVDPVDVVQTNGLFGDKQFDIYQPVMFESLITAAAAGDEGRKVYWQFNNQVQYVPGNNGNLAGMVWWVKDATHVVVVPPWMLADLLGAKAIMTLSGTAATFTLTKFDAGKTFLFPSTVPQTVTLPLSTKLGSGDTIVFVQTGTGTKQVTIAAAGADVINSTSGFAAATYLLGTAQGSRNTLQTDGNGNWYVVG